MDFNSIKTKGMEYVEKGKATAIELTEKGKLQAKLLNERAKLMKAQRQLGALVYSLAKGNEENQPLVDQYIEAISEIEQEMEAIRSALTPAEAAEVADVDAEAEAVEVGAEPAVKACPQCGCTVEEDALFCNKCGAQL